jgi:hypothetical protein
MITPVNNIVNGNKPKENATVTVNYSTNLTTSTKSPLVNPNPTNIQNGKTLNPTQQIKVIGKGKDPEVIVNNSNTSGTYIRQNPESMHVFGPFYNGQSTQEALEALQITNGLTLPEVFNILSQNGININDWKNANLTINGNKIILNNGKNELEIENKDGWTIVEDVNDQNTTYYAIDPKTKVVVYTGNSLTPEIIQELPLMEILGQSLVEAANGPYSNLVFNGESLNQAANQVLQITGGLTLPELFQILKQSESFWTPTYSYSSWSGGTSGSDVYTANVSIQGNKIIFTTNNQYSNSGAGSSTNSTTIDTLTIKPYDVTQNGKTYHLILVKQQQYFNNNYGNDVYQDTITWYYLIDPKTKQVIYKAQEPPQQIQYWLPSQQSESGYIVQPSQAINSVLEQYGYALPSNVLQEINNLQPGQSITVNASSYNSQLQEWGAASAEFEITYLGNDKYKIQSIGEFYNFNNFNNPWTSINETITVPTYSINQNGQISTTNLSISGQVTTYGTTNINLPYYTAAYNVNEIIPTNYVYNPQTGQLTFWGSNPQGGITLQSINAPTLTSQEYIELAQGKIPPGLKPGWYYNPQTQQIIEIASQTTGASLQHTSVGWFGYSSATPQTVQNLPQNTYLFLNPMGYSSTNPNVVYSIGVNFNTNTVYLINSYGQVINTKTFNNIQSMFDYLQKNWNLNLNPTPQPGQPVLSTAVNFNSLNPNLQLQSIILQNDQLVNNAITSLTSNPSTFLQDIATLTAAGFSTALADMGLKSQALSVQNFAQQLYYNSTLGDIVGGAEVGGIILLGFFAPETLLNFAMGAAAGVGIGEALSLATGQGPLSSSQIVAQAELGGLFSMVGGIAGGYLSAAFSKGAGALTTMITGSEEWGSKIAGLTPLWRFAGSEVTNLALSYPFFGNNKQEWLEWSTLFSLGDVFIPSISGSILSRWDVWRGKAVMAEKGPIKLPLEKEPIEGYIAKLPDNTILNIVPRATAGEGTVPEFIETYVYEKGENNLLAHVTPSLTFVNDLTKGKEIEIKPPEEGKAMGWRRLGRFTGFYMSPGEDSNTAVALGFYGGITDTYPSLEYPRFTRMSWREVLYRLTHPFERAGIILTRNNIELGPLPPQELVDYVDYLKSIYGNNKEKIMKELLKNPKYSKMFMEWRNAVKEYSATRGVPVIGSEDILGINHERQAIIEPGAKLKGTRVTYNVWIRQTPKLLENLPGPLKDILSDWSKIKVTYVEVKPGQPTDLFVINNINTQSTTISTNKEYKNEELTSEISNIYENSIKLSETINPNFIKSRSPEIKEIYRETNPYRYEDLNYIKEPLSYFYNIENLEETKYFNYNEKNKYMENIQEIKSYRYNQNEYRENYSKEKYNIIPEEQPYKTTYYKYNMNGYPYNPYNVEEYYYNYSTGEPYNPPVIPPYYPQEYPQKRNLPKYPFLEFSEITIMGRSIKGLVPEFGRGVRTMYDIQYALSRLAL